VNQVLSINNGNLEIIKRCHVRSGKRVHLYKYLVDYDTDRPNILFLQDFELLRLILLMDFRSKVSE